MTDFDMDTLKRINVYVMSWLTAYAPDWLSKELNGETMTPEEIWDGCIGRITKDLTGMEVGAVDLPTVEEMDKYLEPKLKAQMEKLQKMGLVFHDPDNMLGLKK